MPSWCFSHREKGKTEQALSMLHKRGQRGENTGLAVILKEEQIHMISIHTSELFYFRSSWADKEMNTYFIFKLTIYFTEYMRNMLILLNFIINVIIRIVR